jgi:hypothetical protein
MDKATRAKKEAAAEAMVAWLKAEVQAANDRAYFCPDCQNWQLRDSHPGYCPKAAKAAK